MSSVEEEIAEFDAKHKKADSPNASLDRAIKAMLKTAQTQPFDMQLKALNTAINWEKVRRAILGNDDPFDPSEL